MTRVFADSNYFVALLHRRDGHHEAAVDAQRQLTKAHLVTTDEALSEVLAFFSKYGPHFREAAVQIVEELRQDSRVTVFEQSRATFDGALKLYKSRTDKEYSLVDCVSFGLMTRDGIAEALTNDHHFEQEQFVALLQPTTSRRS